MGECHLLLLSQSELQLSPLADILTESNSRQLGKLELWVNLQPGASEFVAGVKLLSLEELLLMRADLRDLLVVLDLDCLVIEMAMRPLSILVHVIITGIDIVLHYVSHSICRSGDRAAGSRRPVSNESLLMQATVLAMCLRVCKRLIARLGTVGHVKHRKFHLRR